MSEMDFRDKIRSYESAVSESSWNRMEELLDNSYPAASEKKRGLPYWLMGGITVLLSSWLAFGSGFKYVSGKAELSERTMKGLEKRELVNPGEDPKAMLTAEAGQGTAAVDSPQITAANANGLEPETKVAAPVTHQMGRGTKSQSGKTNTNKQRTELETDYQAESESNDNWFYNAITVRKDLVMPEGIDTSVSEDGGLSIPEETADSEHNTGTTVRRAIELHSVPLVARPELPQSGRVLPALDAEPILFQPFQRLDITGGVSYATTDLLQNRQVSGIQVHAGLGFHLNNRLEVGTYTSYTYMTKDVLHFGVTPGIESMKYVAQHIRLGYRLFKGGFGDLLVYTGAGYGSFEYLTPWEQPNPAPGPLTLELAGEKYRLAGKLVSVDLAFEFQKAITKHLYLEAQYRVMFNRYFDSFSMINSYGLGLNWRPRRRSRIIR